MLQGQPVYDDTMNLLLILPVPADDIETLSLWLSDCIMFSNPICHVSERGKMFLAPNILPKLPPAEISTGTLQAKLRMKLTYKTQEAVVSHRERD